MYCGSCLHDNTLAAELLKMGEDVLLVPIYTPTRTDEINVSSRRVFFGGINVYLQQKWSFFRRTPRWFDRILDHPAMLGKLAGRSSSVDPAELGELTVSMLRGEDGFQHKELDKLVDWLLEEIRPDVVHLSNVMMAGLARMIAQRCGPPVVCSLSGEDIFLEKLPPPHYETARELLRERSADVQALIALNRYFADFMSDYLSVNREQIVVIPHGLNLEGHGERAENGASEVQRIGFLARICVEKGLHLLVEAAELLTQEDDVPPFELHVAGYLGAGDRTYFRELESHASEGPLKGKFFYHGELDRPGKINFLQSLDVFSTPTVYRESKGIPAMEAMANAVPVVLPQHGAFPELVAETGGGLLCEPHSAEDLAEKIAVILRDPQLGRRLGQQGRREILKKYHATTMAEKTLQLYQELHSA